MHCALNLTLNNNDTSDSVVADCCLCKYGSCEFVCMHTGVKCNKGCVKGYQCVGIDQLYAQSEDEGLAQLEKRRIATF